MAATSLAHRIDASSGSIASETALEIARTLPRLAGGDPARHALLCEVFEGLLREVASALRHGLPPTAGGGDLPAMDALERALVREGVPVTDLVLAMQVAQRVLMQALLREPDVGTEMLAELPAALSLLAGMGEQATRVTVERYAEASALWNRSSGAGLLRRVQRVLDGSLADPGTIDTLLGYPMRGHHVCGVVWNADRDFTGEELLDAHHMLRSLPGAGAALLAPVAERELWCWVGVSGPVDEQAWRDRFDDAHLPVRVALSSAGEGLAGFRSVHRDAVAAARVAQAAGRPRILFHREVAAVALLVQNPDQAREFVAATLGGLAAPSDNAARLRQTLRVHLRGGEDAAATGRALFIHRNTVVYRISKAAALLPRPLDECRLDVALALDYDAWFPLTPAG